MGFKLKADPTFKAVVRIPIPGAESEPVEFTFKHRGRAELLEFKEWCKNEKRTDREVFDAMVVGWGLADAFTPENIDTLLDSYWGASREIATAYMLECTAARLGN